jgi:hypothetical protein
MLHLKLEFTWQVVLEHIDAGDMTGAVLVGSLLARQGMPGMLEILGSDRSKKLRLYISRKREEEEAARCLRSFRVLESAT